MYETEYTVEYRFEATEYWQTVDTFEYENDAYHCLLEHIKTYNHASVRIRRTRQIVEDEVISEFAALNAVES